MDQALFLAASNWKQMQKALRLAHCFCPTNKQSQQSAKRKVGVHKLKKKKKENKIFFNRDYSTLLFKFAFFKHCLI